MARKNRKNVKKLAPELAKGQNTILQGQNSRKQALYSVWSGFVKQGLTKFLEEKNGIIDILEECIDA